MHYPKGCTLHSVYACDHFHPQFIEPMTVTLPCLSNKSACWLFIKCYLSSYNQIKVLHNRGFGASEYNFKSDFNKLSYVDQVIKCWRIIMKVNIFHELFYCIYAPGQCFVFHLTSSCLLWESNPWPLVPCLRWSFTKMWVTSEACELHVGFNVTVVFVSGCFISLLKPHYVSVVSETRMGLMETSLCRLWGFNPIAFRVRFCSPLVLCVRRREERSLRLIVMMDGCLHGYPLRVWACPVTSKRRFWPQIMAQTSLLQGKRFYCREWVFHKIQHCLQEKTSNLSAPGTAEPLNPVAGAGKAGSWGVLLVGGPGSGKTALCTELLWPSSVHGVHRGLHQHCLGYHFCRAEDSDTLCVSGFVRSLVSQIRRSGLVPEYEEKVREPAVQSALQPGECERNPADTFKRWAAFRGVYLWFTASDEVV